MQQVDKGPCEQFGWVGGDSADSETYLLQVFMRRIARYAVYADLLQTCCVFIFKILYLCVYATTNLAVSRSKSCFDWSSMP